jgi:hypothetical protein
MKANRVIVFDDAEHQGFAMFAVLLMLTVLGAMLGAYTVVTRIETAGIRNSNDSVRGFYTAEAGLNVRAEAIRQIFVGYNRPDGTSPTVGGECESGNNGSGDYDCQTTSLGNHEAVTYVEEDPSNPLLLTIPPGERYQNLSAQEYRYTVVSKSMNNRGDVEAILELRFKSRLVPMFQFAAFYNKDLEILPGPFMNLAGPIHTNGDLYLDSGNTLELEGQVTSSGDLYRGRKNDASCLSNQVRILDPASFLAMLPSCSTRTQLTEANLAAWNDMVQIDVPVVTVPEPEILDPTPGQIYWDNADLRLVLHLNSSNNVVTTSSPSGVEIRDASDNVDTSRTNALNACSGSISGRPVGSSNTFINNREGGAIRMVDIDMRALLNCAHTSTIFDASRTLDDDTEGGLVIFAAIDGPNSAAAQSRYGFRVKNSAELQSNLAGAPLVQGLTLVSDQAAYTWGDFNSVNKIPAAILADVYNALSNSWNDANTSWSSRVPSNTTVNAGILAGTDSTGGAEGAGGQSSGNYNGGLENYPRFHEQWSQSPKKDFNYLGSFVSLGTPRHSSGAWVYGSPQYTAPNRYWGFDTDFNNAANLPPITPRFVYLRQQLFLREFEQE